MEEISNKIQRIRKEKGLSQTYVAKIAGIKQPSYASIESGDTRSISLNVAIGIAKALEIPFNELYDIPSPSPDNEVISLLKERNELLAKVEKLENEGRIMQSLHNSIEMINDLNKSAKLELKHLRMLLSLVEYFEILDNDLFARHNAALIRDEPAVAGYSLKVIRRFVEIHGNRSLDEIIKFIDLEKYTKSDIFEFLNNFWGDEPNTKEKIIGFAIKEKQKLIQGTT